MTLNVKMVTPHHGPLDITFNTEEGASNLATCFVLTEANVTYLRWIDGTFEMNMDIPWTGGDEILNGLVEVDLGIDHSTLWIDLCRPPSYQEWIGDNIICRVDAETNVHLEVKNPVRPLTPFPFPTTQSDGPNGSDMTWRFRGPPPPIKAALAVPLDYVARTALTWFGNYYSDEGDYNLDLLYLADNADLSILLALVAVTFTRLRRPVQRAHAADDDTGESGPPNASRGTRAWLESRFRSGASESWRLAIIAFATLLLGVQISSVGEIHSAFRRIPVVMARLICNRGDCCVGPPRLGVRNQAAGGRSVLVSPHGAYTDICACICSD